MKKDKLKMKNNNFFYFKQEKGIRECLKNSTFSLFFLTVGSVT